MHRLFDEGLTRRSLLRLGLSGAALAAMPWPFRGTAAAAAAPHFLVTFFCDGGWDVTQVLDAHDPLDATDGIDVDVPGQPVSQIVTVGPVTYMSNAVTRPAVDAFFSRWATPLGDRERRQHALDVTRPEPPAHADRLPRPDARRLRGHGGASQRHRHAAAAPPALRAELRRPVRRPEWPRRRQLRTVLNYDRIPGRTAEGDSQLAVSALGEAYVQQALARQEALENGGALHGRLAQFVDSNDRGDRLVRLASSLPRDNNDWHAARGLARRRLPRRHDDQRDHRR
jgi:hypothetical protein